MGKILKFAGMIDDELTVNTHPVATSFTACVGLSANVSYRVFAKMSEAVWDTAVSRWMIPYTNPTNNETTYLPENPIQVAQAKIVFEVLVLNGGGTLTPNSPAPAV